MAHPYDVHVGKMVHQRRSLLGMTTQQLGDSVGITYPQIQRYETGADSISASRIWDIAAALEVPVMFFFEGLDDQPTHSGEARGHILTDNETLDLARVLSDTA
jgi:transcriptional regulator with XRE-family HTH domain